MDERQNLQSAPWPGDLEDIIEGLTYRPGWTFALRVFERDEGCHGLTLDIVTLGYDSYHPDQGQHYRVHHYHPVPAATYNYDSWLWWVRSCLEKVEQHELNEFLTVYGEKPYAPSHGPGEDPYYTHVPTDVQRNTSFQGILKPPAPERETETMS